MQSVGKKYTRLNWLRIVWLASLVVLSARAQLTSHINIRTQAMLQKAIDSKNSRRGSIAADTYETTTSTERSSHLSNVAVF